MTRIRGWAFAVAAVATVAASGLVSGGGTATATTAAPTVAIVGDSFTAGIGSDCGCPSQAWFTYMARDLGWQVTNVIADPGAGFQNGGDFGTLAQAAAAHPIPPSTDYVIVQGGLDDTLLDPLGEAAAVHHTLDVVRAQAPRAVVIVVGAFFPFPDHLDSPNQIPVARRIGDYTAIGDTRYIAPFLCEFPVTADGVHPTAAGHHEIGDWIAWHLAHSMSAGERLAWHPELGYWTA